MNQRPLLVVHGRPTKHDHTHRIYPCGLIEYRENYGNGVNAQVSTKPGDVITCTTCISKSEKYIPDPRPTVPY